MAIGHKTPENCSKDRHQQRATQKGYGYRGSYVVEQNLRHSREKILWLSATDSRYRRSAPEYATPHFAPDPVVPTQAFDFK